MSRPWRDVVDEARRLADLGAVELNLVGQNVNAYDGGVPLAGLIGKIAAIDGVRRIRFTTSYPSEMTPDMMDLFAAEPKLMPLLYLPMQSASDRILRLMNRRYTAGEYFAIAEKLPPNVRLSSDFIVGVPTETDEDFALTLAAVKRAGFIQSFAFRYSPRPGTAAARMDDQVPQSIKTERIKLLLGALRESQDAFNKSFKGRTTGALFTEARGSEIIGRNEYQQVVIARGSSNAIGKILPVKVKRASYANLRGALI